MSTSSRQIIATDMAPQAIGPYSQAILAGNHLFVSGQIAIDPASGTFVAGDIKSQTRQVFTNLEAILLASGYSFEEVVFVQVFLTDMSHFAEMNAIYAQYFSAAPPARAAIEAAALPKGALIEICLQAIKTA
ncbi:MAG: reactive intermediate/imine deaminase [Deltaproteobacteria bacterium]|nr:reactive intermediate/imine deaminase [Deltaproteobacteria bacterium]